MLAMVLIGDAFSHVLAEPVPNAICESAYCWPRLFSVFTMKTIYGDPDRRRTGLSLCRPTRRLLLLQLGVLGIEPDESM